MYLVNDKSITKKLLSLVVIAYFVVSLLLQNDTIYLSSNLKNIFSGFMPQYSFMTPIILIIYIGIFKTIKHFKFDNFSENEISSFDSNALLLEIRKYYYMFQNCASLNSITVYADDISATNCTNFWLSGVASSGTFRNLGSATYPTGVSGIPSGWTEVKN